MKEPLVPHGTFATCTNGLKPWGSEIIVSSKNNAQVKLQGGKLMATELDKPKNFACVWAGLIIAAIVALCVASGGLIIGILVATAAGIGASFTAGNFMCYIATRNTPWTHTHPRIKIEGKLVITGKSTMHCRLAGGNIQIFFSKDVANAHARIHATKNAFLIFTSAFFFSTAPRALWTAGKGLISMGKMLWPMSKFLAFAGPATTVVVSFGINNTISEYQDRATNYISDHLSDHLSDTPAGTNPKESISDSFPELVSGIDNTDVVSVANISEIASDGVTSTVSLGSEFIQVSQESFHNQNAISRKAIMDMTWEIVRKDPNYQGGGPSVPQNKEIFSNALKQAHSVIKKSNWNISLKKAFSHLGNKLKDQFTLQNLKRLIPGLDTVVEIIADISLKTQLKNLDKWGKDAEAAAKAQIKVNETEI